jgi:GDSL-like Lipase/Acylhydrolase family
VDLGQALVISMLVIALIGALVVFTSDAIRDSKVRNQSKLPSRPVHWLHLSGSDAADTDASWVNQIHASLSQEVIVLSNLATPGATAGQFAQLLTSGDSEVEVDVATLWIGPEDFLAGFQILEFEEYLNSILTWLEARKATTLVGNLPDLSAELVAAKLADPKAVHPVIDQWNASIARLSASHGATIVEFNEPLELARSPIRYLYTTKFDPNPEAQAFVADQFAAAMSVVLDQLISDRS